MKKRCSRPSNILRKSRPLPHVPPRQDNAEAACSARCSASWRRIKISVCVGLTSFPRRGMTGMHVARARMRQVRGKPAYAVSSCIYYEARRISRAPSAFRTRSWLRELGTGLVKNPPGISSRQLAVSARIPARIHPVAVAARCIARWESGNVAVHQASSIFIVGFARPATALYLSRAVNSAILRTRDRADRVN